MKVFIFSILLLAFPLVCYSGLVYSLDNFSEQVEKCIVDILPTNWKVFAIQERNDPKWSFSDDLGVFTVFS